MSSLTARWHRSIDEISEPQWRALVGDTAIPFYRWNWLEALESSGSTIPDQGWQPLHLALWRDEVPIAVAPVICEGP
jgi:predicted N-acyltransferase